MKSYFQKPNQYYYITSKNGERMTSRQWAKRFLGLMAKENFRTFTKSIEGNFTPNDLNMIELIVLDYARLLSSRRGFDFPHEESPRTMKGERNRLTVDR